ncbi:hypothetical protein CDL15_Pgr008308 [Punica granatum]|uniref:PPM-type phosphatase domain-containing protein n=1 Tax=Punica granatum TaxID=22663 RepID=A0A218XH80_PUNGR|nr:hypothetical protein CDL15_Pgr008308 [Punica granatum]
MASKHLFEYFMLHAYFLLDSTFSVALKKFMGKLGRKGDMDALFQVLKWHEDLCWQYQDQEGVKSSRTVEFDHSYHLEILKEALTRAIRDIDAKFSKASFDEASRSNLNSGSTATVILVADGKILVANVGDSKALLCSERFQSPADARATLLRLHREKRRGGAIMPMKYSEHFKLASLNGLTHFSVQELTRDHSPDMDDERSRVEAAGGSVLNLSGVPRVNGQLAVSRATGDVKFKSSGVIAAPEVMDWQSLNINDSYLVAASDGVFEELSPQDGNYTGGVDTDTTSVGLEYKNGPSGKGLSSDIIGLEHFHPHSMKFGRLMVEPKHGSFCCFYLAEPLSEDMYDMLEAPIHDWKEPVYGLPLALPEALNQQCDQVHKQVERGHAVYLSGLREKYFGEIFLNASSTLGDQLSADDSFLKEKRSNFVEELGTNGSAFHDMQNKENFGHGFGLMTSHKEGLEHIARYVESFESKSIDIWLVFRHEGVSLSKLIYTTEQVGDKEEGEQVKHSQVLYPSKWWKWLKTTKAGKEEMRNLIWLLETGRCMREGPSQDKNYTTKMRIIDFGSAIDEFTLKHLYGSSGPSRAEQTSEYAPPEALLNTTWYQGPTSITLKYISPLTAALLDRRLEGWDEGLKELAYSFPDVSALRLVRHLLLWDPKMKNMSQTQSCYLNYQVRGRKPPPGQCKIRNGSECCKEGKMYPIYKCSQPVSSHAKAMLNHQQLREGQDWMDCWSATNSTTLMPSLLLPCRRDGSQEQVPSKHNHKGEWEERESHGCG